MVPKVWNRWDPSWLEAGQPSVLSVVERRSSVRKVAKNPLVTQTAAEMVVPLEGSGAQSVSQARVVERAEGSPSPRDMAAKQHLKDLQTVRNRRLNPSGVNARRKVQCRPSQLEGIGMVSSIPHAAQ